MSNKNIYTAGCTYRGLFPVFHAKLANRMVERELNRYDVEATSHVQRIAWTEALMFITMRCTKTRLESVRTLLGVYGFDIVDSHFDVVV